MMSRNHDQAECLDDLFGEILRLAPEDRQRFLANVESDELRQELALLLAADEAADAEGYLIHPAVSEAKTDASTYRTCDTDDEDPIPATMGRYQIRSRIGKGGAGSVYLAYDPQLDRQVAIKVPNRHVFELGISVETFRQEARNVAQVESRALVSVYDVQEDNGRPYIVQQYVDGCSFDEWASQQTLSSEAVVSKVIEIAEAVGELHQHGIVHRDLKPRNVLVDRSGQILIADFGLALHEIARFAHRGEIAGTPAYMSPEQVRGETHNIDGRSDVWAIGVIFYELLLDIRPFRGETCTEIFECIKNSDPKPPRQLRPSIPNELQRICLKCLAKRRADRFQSTADLIDDLRYWLKEGRTAHGQDETSGGSARASVTPSISNPESARDSRTQIVPKGLRAFDEQDASFFLNLLPGPRDRDGLPESIRFWKRKIEEFDPDRTFKIGVIYGPSGCGKSSLINAGLLPRLDPRVRRVCVEAVPGTTEHRLLRSLRRLDLGIPFDSSLVESVRYLRQRNNGLKVLIVLDQFEQWLRAHEKSASGQLLDALRQCDGEHVQCIVLVRDEFWMPITRLFRVLEIRLLEDETTKSVDRFPIEHAKDVLELFGRAYGALHDTLSNDNKSFISEAVQGLAEEGKVVCVHLSLFCQMMKDLPWTLTSLKAVGGAEGVGVTFLEEAFSSSAPIGHRIHQTAARAVLESLTPESATDFKGVMRSQDELMAVSGYANRREEFNELVRILDSELRIITPTNPEGQFDVNDDQSPLDPSSTYYQLTHDFLVSPLREWLTKKRNETWRGRAKQCLEERANQYRRYRQARFVPSPLEYVAIQAGVSRRSWNVAQREVMRAATHRYRNFTTVLLLVTLVVSWTIWELNGRIQANLIVRNILTAAPEEVTDLIHYDLRPYWRWAKPALTKTAIDESADRKRRLHANLAVLAYQPGAAPIEYLHQQLLNCTVDEFPLIRDVLKHHWKQLSEVLWRNLRDVHASTESRFSAGMALAHYAADSADWTDADADFLVEVLLNSDPDDQQEFREFLSPIAHRLVRPLTLTFHDSTARDDVRQAAANALAKLVKTDLAYMAELASAATPSQYPVLFAELNLARAGGDTTGAESLVSITQEHPEPGMSAAQRITRGKRRAAAAASLIRLGMPESAFDAFDFGEDIESLTQFVHGSKERGVMAEQVLDCLEQARSVAVRYALLLTLGEYQLSDIVASRQQPLHDQLVAWYRGDPSSAIHGAVGWLLRTWGFENEVARVDETPLVNDSTGHREWFVMSVNVASEKNSHTEYFTFIVVDPGQFTMGSPENEPHRGEGEAQRVVRLPRRFAVSDREVARGQFERFVRAQGIRWQDIRQYSPTGQYPVVSESWHQAVAYCRWLTEQAGMSEEEQCYEKPESLQKVLAEHPSHWPSHPGRQGFRLPTEAEWEFLCRGQTGTPYTFGSDPSLLTEYGWFQDNADNKVRLGGQLRPSPRGFFDLHGNVREWCHDWYPLGLGRRDRPCRGGCWYLTADYCRSSCRVPCHPAMPDKGNGFRLAISLGNADQSPNP